MILEFDASIFQHRRLVSETKLKRTYKRGADRRNGFATNTSLFLLWTIMHRNTLWMWLGLRESFVAGRDLFHIWGAHRRLGSDGFQLVSIINVGMANMRRHTVCEARRAVHVPLMFTLRYCVVSKLLNEGTSYTDGSILQNCADDR